MNNEEYDKWTHEERVSYHVGCLLVNIGANKFRQEVDGILQFLEKRSQEKIKKLEEKVEKLYTAGSNGISYVGRANYAERESEAHEELNKVYYDEKL